MVVANFQQLTSNLGAKVKRVSHGGRSYLVAPASLIVPGVLNGSDGALYYPPEEISRNVSAWDGVPLVVYHPLTENGEPTSALDENGRIDRKVYERVGVGALRNTRYDGRLVSEAWFDEEHTRNADVKLFGPAKILPRLNAEQAIELSTGLHLEQDKRAGVCPKTNRSYDSSTRNYKPDHLAVLPDQRGACSVEDGCGVVVNAEESEGKWVTLPNGVHIMVKDGEIVHGPDALKGMTKKEREKDNAKKDKERGMPKEVAAAKARLEKFKDENEIRNEEATENVGKYGNPQCGDTGHFMPHGSGTGKGLVHGAAKEGRHGPKAVENDCAGGLAENCSQTSKVMNQGDKTMTVKALKPEERTSLLTKLVANCRCSDEDAKVLNTLSDSALVRVANAFPMAKQKEDPEDVADGGADEEEETPKGGEEKKVPPQFAKNQSKERAVTTNAAVENKQMSFEELLQAAPPAYKAVWNTAVKVEQRERKDLLNKLIANVSDEKKKETTWNAFKDKPIDELQAIVDLMPAPQVRNAEKANPLFPTFPNYAGASGYSDAVTNQQGGNEDEDVLELPTMNWGPETVKA